VVAAGATNTPEQFAAEAFNYAELADPLQDTECSQDDGTVVKQRLDRG